MIGLTWVFGCPSEAIREDHVAPRRFPVRKRLEYDTVAVLREGRPVPRTVEGYERSATIGGWKLLSLVEREIVGRPMTRKRRNRGALLCALANRLAAISAVLRGEDQLLMSETIVAIGPTIVCAMFELHQLLDRLFDTLRGL